MPLHDVSCPTCNGRTQVMAGANILPQFKEHLFLVCWKCRKVRHQNENSKWTAISVAKQLMPKAG